MSHFREGPFPQALFSLQPRVFKTKPWRKKNQSFRTSWKSHFRPKQAPKQSVCPIPSTRKSGKQEGTDKALHIKVPKGSGPQPFWHQGPVLWKTIFPWMGAGEIKFPDDSSTLHLSCTLFLLLLRQCHLRSSGIRSGRLRAPAIGHK